MFLSLSAKINRTATTQKRKETNVCTQANRHHRRRRRVIIVIVIGTVKIISVFFLKFQEKMKDFELHATLFQTVKFA